MAIASILDIIGASITSIIHIKNRIPPPLFLFLEEEDEE
jgi:hypothetical protein